MNNENKPLDSSLSDGARDRAYTLNVLERIAQPVLEAQAAGQLRSRMPVEGDASRAECTHLEAIGRLLAGLAPWLELGPDDAEEGKLRARYIDLAVQSIAQGLNPKSPDCFNFDRTYQPLVDASFLAHALLRAPRQLWGNLDNLTRERLVEGLISTRVIPPSQNNWLLFSAMVEMALWHFGNEGDRRPIGKADRRPIDSAIQKHLEWYAGDGVYGDGRWFHWDYYNGFVIQPMLLDILELCAEKNHPMGVCLPLVRERARRHAEIQERLISPEGTFPIMGRSSCYRFGAFQLLSQMAWTHRLPESLAPSGVRAALTAVVRRMIEAPGTFDANGWLQLGVVGHQPAQAEGYISTGSLYLCAVGLLHLGLPASDPFWSAPAQPWTQRRLWAGENLPADHALADTFVAAPIV